MAIAVIIPVCVSYARAVLRPGHSTLPLRTGLWLRDHGMSTPVNVVEWCWYTLRRGHTMQGVRPQYPALHSDNLRRHERLAASLPPPRTVGCAASACTAAEGSWLPIGVRVDGTPTIYETFFRPDAVHEHVWVAAAAIESTRVRAELVAGTREPIDFHGAWGGAIPRKLRSRLVAAFNGGFRFADSPGGFYAENRSGMPLRDGFASFVVYADGHTDVGVWGRDVRLAPDVKAVRQNLFPIVERGRPVNGLDRNEHGEWGAGWNQGLYAWRSGLGISAAGSLIYLAGDGLTLTTLASALAQAGCIRAMELDIHDMWITFEIYARDSSSADGVVSRKLMPGMAFDDRRYLLPDDKDFIALFAR